MAQADWIRYGNEGGAKAQQIARLREMFGNVGAFTPTQVSRQFYGGDQFINGTAWDLQNQNVTSGFKQLGINPVQTRYSFAEPRQVQDSFDQTSWSPYQDDEAMLARGYKPTGVSYTLPVQADPEREGKKGFYTIGFNADGTIGDINWQNQELSKGWFGDNIEWLGPALVGGAALAGLAAAGGAAGAGGAAAGGVSAAPISASSPSWLAGYGTTAGLTPAQIASVQASLAAGATSPLGLAGTAGAIGGGTSAATTGGGLFSGANMANLAIKPILQLGADALGQYLGGNAKDDAARAALRASQGLSAEQRAYFEAAAADLERYRDQIKNTGDFTPWNVVSGQGSWMIDPATGRAVQMPSEALKGYEQWAFDRSKEAQEKLADFDRDRFAGEAYDRYQGLLSRSRNAQQDKLLADMDRKGLTGLQVTDAGGSDPTRYNPVIAAMTKEWADQDKALAVQSLNDADREMATLQGRATGLFGAGAGVSDLLRDELDTGRQLEADEYRRQIDLIRNLMGLDEQQAALYLQGIRPEWATAQMQIEADLARRTGRADSTQNLIRTGGSLLGGWLGKYL